MAGDKQPADDKPTAAEKREQTAAEKETARLNDLHRQAAAARLGKGL
jgi:hypothetical protein